MKRTQVAQDYVIKSDSMKVLKSWNEAQTSLLAQTTHDYGAHNTTMHTSNKITKQSNAKN